MAASDSATTFPPEEAEASSGTDSGRRTQLLVGLVVAALIVLGAVYVGVRSGWDSIGAGVNRSLLPKVGEPAPDFMTEDVFGNAVRLSQFKGQPVWLMFWGSWCPPCRAEFPDIQAAYAQMEPEGIRLLGVSLREPAIDAGAYAAQNGATFLVLSDPDESDTGDAYPIFNFPTHIFIDRDGIIRSIILEDMSTEQALAEGRRLLENHTN